MKLRLETSQHFLITVFCYYTQRWQDCQVICQSLLSSCTVTLRVNSLFWRKGAMQAWRKSTNVQLALLLATPALCMKTCPWLNYGKCWIHVATFRWLIKVPNVLNTQLLWIRKITTACGALALARCFWKFISLAVSQHLKLKLCNIFPSQFKTIPIQGCHKLMIERYWISHCIPALL